jgi:predicted P-loop ATPase
MAKISLFPNIRETKLSVDTTEEMFLDDIRLGKWQDEVLRVRVEPDKAKRSQLKAELLPYVTLSGKFSERKVSGLVEHSGFLAMDIDDVEDVEKTKNKLAADRYVFAVFTSVSGRGLCVMFRIAPERHLDAFLGLQEYLFNNYQESIDPSCKDVSRPRYVSYDPHLHVNTHAKKFTEYPKKKDAPKKAPPVVFVGTDFDNIINDISQRNIDLTGSYQQWLSIGFAFAHQFDEGGRQYFHAVSCHSLSYNPALCDKQYSNCLKAGRQGVTIATFYFLCKQAGLSVVSELTRDISRAAANNKTAGLSKEKTIANILESFPDAPVEDIVNQVFDFDIAVDDASEIEAVEIYLRNNFQLKKNLISQRLENGPVVLGDADLDKIEIETKKKFEKIDYTTLGKLIRSVVPVPYNPILDFFEKYKDRRPEGAIDRLFACITSPTGAGSFDDYVGYFGKKWLVGAVACLFEDPSPLMLILCGNVGTGKSYFFQNLLPRELSQFKARKSFAQLSSDTFRRDLEILSTQTWLIYDDELAGKSKRDQGIIKALLSATDTTNRAAYGRTEETRKRIAFYGGTCNDLEIWNDSVDNRRYVPVEVTSIDWSEINAIDPVDYIMEAYHLFKDGFDYRVLGSDIKLLNQNTEEFRFLDTEEELLNQYFARPDKGAGVGMTATQIKCYIEDRHKGSMNVNKLGAALKRSGILQAVKKSEGKTVRLWYVKELQTGTEPFYNPQSGKKPF